MAFWVPSELVRSPLWLTWAYAWDGSLLQRTLEKCGKCGEVVQEHVIRALDRAFHPTCFTCVTCARCIRDENFALDNQNEVYCLDDFYRYERGPSTEGTGWDSGRTEELSLSAGGWVRAFLQKPVCLFYIPSI